MTTAGMVQREYRYYLTLGYRATGVFCCRKCTVTVR